MCTKDQACIDRRKACDRFPDCSDGSDETKELCGADHQPYTTDTYTTEGSPDDTQGCLPHEFECDDGACIDDRRLCDGRSDCERGEDEDQRRCYDLAHTEQSPDDTTEQNQGFPTAKSLPEPQQCQAHEFQCQDRSCIDLRRICDGNSDCSRGEDEDQNICYLGTLATEQNVGVEHGTEPYYDESYDQHNSNAESTTGHCK